MVLTQCHPGDIRHPVRCDLVPLKHLRVNVLFLFMVRADWGYLADESEDFQLLGLNRFRTYQPTVDKLLPRQITVENLFLLGELRRVRGKG